MTIPSLKEVLLVEDESDIQVVARMALESGGLAVKVCGTGQEALRIAAEFPPDLILLDVMMPGMDGPSTLKALRAIPSAASIPIIFITAKVQLHEIDQYKALGAIDVIRKPFDPMTLVSTIRNIWTRRYGE